MHRRHLLQMTAAALTVGVAGCGQEDGPTTDEETPTATSTPEADTPTGDSAGETATATGTPGATPTATPTATATEAATDAPDGTGTPTPVDTETPTATATPTDAPDGTGTPTPVDTETPTATATPTTTTPTPTPTMEGDVSVTVNNVGARAWEVTEGADEVASEGGENPTLSLSVGTRYVVTNDGWDFHPFALRDADDDPLLSQSADGRYDSDDAVDWVDEGEAFAFTVTADLAADLDYYICTVHSSMRGSVQAD
jgi:hypothetical protein